MEDLLLNFQYPCRIDFKVGTRQWDLFASEKFRKSLIAKCNVSTSHSIGVRLVSVELFDKYGKVLENSTKSYNMRLSKTELQKKIDGMFPVEVRRAAGAKVSEIKKAYETLLKTRPRFRMYSSSILICFDAANPSETTRVALIDFAHTHFDISLQKVDAAKPEYNDGMILGLESLSEMLTKHV